MINQFDCTNSELSIFMSSKISMDKINKNNLTALFKIYIL